MTVCVKCHKEMPETPFCPWCGHKQTAPIRTARRRGNGTGTVFKRGRYWYAQVTTYAYVTNEDGEQDKIRQRRTKGGFETKKAALEYLPALTGEKRDVPTLAELYAQFERTDLPKLSKDKQSGYKMAYKRIKTLLSKPISELTVADMQAVVDKEAKTYYTARDIKNLLSKLYQKAMPDQYVTQNLARFIVLPDANEAEAKPFTAEEVDKMWTAYADGNTFVGYLLLMIYSGLMPGELFACKADMIDLDKCEIYGVGKKTKIRKDAPVVFADTVRPVVEELIANADGGKLYPKEQSSFYREYHKAVKEIGVRDLPVYSCRHTTGTEAARQNLNAATIQKIMRHGKITTSQRYIHLGEDDAHKGLNQIAPRKAE